MKSEMQRAYRETGPPKRSGYSPGFTLIEMILATVISALVIAIMSVCLSFSLRAWERLQNHKPDQSASLVDLLKLQLAELDPTPVKFENGSTRIIFRGDVDTLAFATSHSVRAISHGVPVVVRYTFDPKSKVLFYSEIPFDPYHGEAMQEFLESKSAGAQQKARLYKIQIADFGISYLDGERDQSQKAWARGDRFPAAVVLNWTTPDAGDFTRLLTVNSPFTVQPPEEGAAQAQALLGGSAK